MPKEYFSVAQAVSLSTLHPGAKIHVIGVCGVAMAQLSIALTERGFHVTGSDKEFYEPMKTLLSNSKVVTQTGYLAENVADDLDLVVIGNAISYGNPEVDVVEQKQIPYTLFPKLLCEVAIAGKHSIVVTGTHGKSTTTAMIASALIALQAHPSYFVGGVAKGLPQSLAVGSGNFSVVEGDEYDSAFFAKVPKFSFYKADTAIINAIEFDHADIYPNVEAIEAQFNALVAALPQTGVAICCIDFPRVRELVSQWKSTTNCKIVTFGTSPDAHYVITSRKPSGLAQLISIKTPSGGKIEIELPAVGEYNARNALAAYIALTINGFPIKQVLSALSKFERVKRRQEVRLQKDGVILIEDFAHHPTAVDQTIDAVKEAFPDARIWAVFEPRSNTSRRKVFQEDYIRAFRKASKVILKDVTARAIDQGVDLLDVSELARKVSEEGTPCECLPDVKAIQELIWREVKPVHGEQEVKDVIVVMSNGSFDGLNQGLEDHLRAY